MAQTLLVTRPEHDLTTRYLSKWSESVIYASKKKGVNVIDLHREKANRERVIGTLEKRSPRLVWLNGHGNEKAVMGHENKEILCTNDREAVQGKIIYARSCESAKVLGKASVRNGATAYLGYTEDFIFYVSVGKVSNPIHDKTAALFLKPSNHVVLALLKGHSAREANVRARSLFRQNIEKLLVAGPSADSYYAIRYLYWDMTHQVCLGDEEASL